MRLLNTRTYELKDFPSKPESYAILSHRWDANELTFADLKDLPRAKTKPGWTKIEEACRVAREDYKLEFLWLDMCCIDKESSVELSEAINSMFAWYRDATICLAYLNDVRCIQIEDPKSNGSSFRNSVWFQRGWTLQELIAPNTLMVFLSRDWNLIGTRPELAETISEITNIDVELLSRVAPPDGKREERLDFSRWSIAARMSWAANRTTTRPEDCAYSLAGLFDVSMTIIYGEGGEKAFWRLQLEIIQQSTDQSIFAWGSQVELRYMLHTPSWGPTSPLGGYNFDSFKSPRNLLASHPSGFNDSAGIWPVPADQLTLYLGIPPLEERHFSRTNNGVRIQLPLLRTRSPGVFVAALACCDVVSGNWQALVLRQVDGEHTYVCNGRFDPTAEEELRILDVTRGVPPHRVLSACQPPWKASTIYIQWQPVIQGPTVKIPRLRRVGLPRIQFARWPHLGSKSDDQWLRRAAGAIKSSIDAATGGLPPYRWNLSGTLKVVSGTLTACMGTPYRPILKHIHRALEVSHEIAAVADSTAYGKIISCLRLSQATAVFAGIEACHHAWPLDVNSHPGSISMDDLVDSMIKIESHVQKLGGLIKTCTEATRQGIALEKSGLLYTVKDSMKTLDQDLSRICLRSSLPYLFGSEPEIREALSRAKKSLPPASSRKYVTLKLDEVINSASRLTNTVGYGWEFTLNGLPRAATQESAKVLVERDLKRFLFSVYLQPQANFSEHVNSSHPKSEKSTIVQPCELIRSPDIRDLWGKMRWGASTDTNTFVLRLYAYFIEWEHEARVQARSTSITIMTRKHPNNNGRRECMIPEDVWCLNYFRYDTVATLMEVLDHDLNGLVDVEKVNRFTSAQPADISLMQWVVYNLYGRPISIHLYHLRIEGTIERLLDIDYVRVRPASSVCKFLDDLIPRVTAFLRDLHEPDLGAQTTELLELVHKIMERQDREIQERFVERYYCDPFAYDWKTEFEYAMMGNNSEFKFTPLEERVPPAVALLMHHYYSVLSQGRLYALDSAAADRAIAIITGIWDMMKERMNFIYSCFSNAGYDIERVMEYAANGMFHGLRRYHIMNDSVTKNKMLKQWRLPWKLDRPIQWISHELAKYDPHFSPDSDLASIEKPLALLSAMVPTLIGHDLSSFMSVRMRYGITLVDSSVQVQAVECVNQGEGAAPVDRLEDGDESNTTCDSCRAGLVGLRFVCIDCDRGRYGYYCPACYVGASGTCRRGSKHRFLRVERGHLYNGQFGMLRFHLRGCNKDEDTEDEDTQPPLNPLFAHCLSASEDISGLPRLEDAIFSYWKHCVAFDGTAMDVMGVGPLEALDAALSAIPNKVREYMGSQSYNELVQMRATANENGDVTLSVRCSRKGQGCEEGDDDHGERYKCADCPDVEYCSRCFVAHHSKHKGGSHRFLLFRRPNSETIIERVVFTVKHYNQADHYDPGRDTGTASEEDVSESSDSDHGSSENDDSEDDIRDSETQRGCSFCEHPRASGEDAYRCLSCKLFRERDILLCRECALKDTIQDEHYPSHILAVLPTRTPHPDHTREAVIAQPKAPVSIAEAAAGAPSSKFEEEVSVLRAMAGRLQLARAPLPPDGSQHSNMGEISQEATTDASSARMSKEEPMVLLSAVVKKDIQSPPPPRALPIANISNTANEASPRITKMDNDSAFFRATAEKSQAHTTSSSSDRPRGKIAQPDGPDGAPDSVAKTVEGEGEVVRSSRGWKGRKDRLIRRLRLLPGRHDGK